MGAAEPNATEETLYWNPVSVCSPLATAGNSIVTVAVLPAVSEAVTVTLAVSASAVSGVPSITPVPVSKLNPDGSSVAPYSALSLTPDGVIASIGSPTCSVAGTVYVGTVGAVRSTVNARCTVLGGV